MRQFLAKLALSTTLVSAGAMAALACPQTTAMGKDTGASGSFQLAQSSGGSTSGGAAGTSPADRGAGTSSGGGTSDDVLRRQRPGGPVIPPDQPMRQPATPTTPGAPTQMPSTR